MGRCKISITKEKLGGYLAQGKTRKEIGQIFGCSVSTIAGRIKEYGLVGVCRRADVKPVFSEEAVEKIRNTVKGKFAEGDKMGFKREEGLAYKSLQPDYTTLCLRGRCDECGETNKLVLHHIDGNQNNSLLTNLQTLCLSCHDFKYYQPYMTIIVSINFSSAHHIKDHPSCGETHGHNYKLTVELGGRLNKKLMVRDFGEVKDILKEVVVEIDHKYLNKVFDFDYVTSEWLIIQVFRVLNQKLKGLKKITLSEGETTLVTLSDSSFQEFLGHIQSRKGRTNLLHFIYKTKVWNLPDNSAQVWEAEDCSVRYLGKEEQ